VQDFVQKAPAFAAKGARVVFVYPGPSSAADKTLAAIAGEFLAGKTLPEGFQMLLDPDYVLTNAYGLRWDQPMETAYPSVFLIDRNGEVFFSRIVKSHGGRVAAQEIVDLLPSPRKPAGGSVRQQP
jgi:alkyl hydroperoxide reductase subunit AhpC